MSCYLSSSKHTHVKHHNDEYTRTRHRTKEHIDTSLPSVWSCLPRQHVLWRHNSLQAQNGFLVCLQRGVPVPITKTIWRVKVSTPRMCAYNVIRPTTSVLVTSIHCIHDKNRRILSATRQSGIFVSRFGHRLADVCTVRYRTQGLGRHANLSESCSGHGHFRVSKQGLWNWWKTSTHLNAYYTL